MAIHSHTDNRVSLTSALLHALYQNSDVYWVEANVYFKLQEYGYIANPVNKYHMQRKKSMPEIRSTFRTPDLCCVGDKRLNHRAIGTPMFVLSWWQLAWSSKTFRGCELAGDRLVGLASVDQIPTVNTFSFKITCFPSNLWWKRCF